ncbi:MAG: sulfotransferase [Proteobacteria bacterium]|nr:sulfotransferase [Pseudomonadota bacterium]HQR02973.1 sulfotransferase [Rhodocyclaceae bacterium]
MSNEIHIDDLIHPVLTEAQQAAVNWGESVHTELSVESVLEEARQRTGLTDFGTEDFTLRLGLLCDEWGGDANVTGLNRMTLRGYLTRYASNRLLIQDTFKRHPEIREQKIERPIIVAGLPRSGTTHLVNLIAADSRFHSLPLWESYEPLPMPGESLLPDGTDPRYQRCADAWEQLQAVAPLIAAMHPMEPDHIHEELELMGPDFASYNFEWLAFSPRWRDDYYSHDQTPHYEYMKDVLKLIQWRRGGPQKRWVLKCPQHMEQLPVLRKVFPDATVVITHRDPVSVVQSSVTMIAYGQRMNMKKIFPDALARYWIDRVEHLIRACVRDREVIPASASHDSYFHQFMADEMGTVATIYAKAGLELTPAARAELVQYGKDHPRGKEGRVIYHLKRDFGIDPVEIRKRYQFYFDRFPVRIEE